MDGPYGMGQEKKKNKQFWWANLTKTTHRMPWCEWEDNIKMVLKNSMAKVWACFILLKDRDWLMGCCKCGTEPSGSIKYR